MSTGKFTFEVGQSSNYYMHMTQIPKTFADAFNEHVKATGRQITEISRASGVDKDALYAPRRNRVRNMSVDLAIKVAGAFGKTVEEFMGLTPVQIHDSLARQLEKLSPKERQLLEASITAFLANQDQAEAPQDATPTAAPDLALKSQ
jgi:hypothetical protein